MEFRKGICQDCNATYKLPASFEHSRAKCKQCGGVVEVGEVQGKSEPVLKEVKPSGKSTAKAKGGLSMKEKLLAERKAAAGKAEAPVEEQEEQPAAKPVRASRAGSGRGSSRSRGRKAEESEEVDNGEVVRSHHRGGSSARAREKRQPKSKTPLFIGIGVVVVLVVAGFLLKDTLMGGGEGPVVAGPGGQDPVADAADQAPEQPDGPQRVLDEQGYDLDTRNARTRFCKAVIAAFKAAGGTYSGYVRDECLDPWCAKLETSLGNDNDSVQEAYLSMYTGDEAPYALTEGDRQTEILDAMQAAWARDQEMMAEKARLASAEELVTWEWFEDLEPWRDTTEEEWAEMNELAALWFDWDAGSDGLDAGKELASYYRKAFPVILNHLKQLDFATDAGMRTGDWVQRTLQEICGGKNYEWRYKIDPESDLFNRKAVASWHRLITEQILASDKAWAGVLDVDVSAIPDPGGGGFDDFGDLDVD